MKASRCMFIIWLIVAFVPQLAAAESELDVAAQVTGVALAEERRLAADDTIEQSNGTPNSFLAAAKRHQLEFAELLGLAELIKEELANTQTYKATEEQVEALLQKNAALQIQAMRYVQGLEMSRTYVQSGFRPASSDPHDWDGRMCNDENECIKLDPITALFTIATAQTRQ